MRFLAALFLFLSALPAAQARPCKKSLEPGDHCRAKISELFPTQMNVGMVDVKAKREEIHDLSRKELKEYLREHPTIVVIGPGGKLYMVDRHHTTRAAYLEGVGKVDVEVLANLSDLSPSDFWEAMQDHHWVRRRNAKGALVSLDKMPKHIRELPDDPYRSLAWVIRQSDAFQKSPIPFAEFAWADFLRERIPENELKDWHGAVKKAIAYATTALTKELPGHAPVVAEELDSKRAACWQKFQALKLPIPSQARP